MIPTKAIALFSLFFVSISCNQKTAVKTDLVPKIESIQTEQYELFIPPIQEGFLILFPCFPCDAANTKAEFDIVDDAMAHNIAVLLMNFNEHLWLSEDEKSSLEEIMLDAMEENQINSENSYIGGFSGGGNVTLLLGNYLKSKNSPLQPKGLFIVDSPIDLLGLYENAQRTIAKNYFKIAVDEAEWIVNIFETEFGKGDTAISHIQNTSPYTSQTHFTKNLSELKNLSLRFYSEPDTLWWKENRHAEYEEMNAFYIEQLAADLEKQNNGNSISYIQTVNKGYRLNGERHPHSWSIVDKEDLIRWILEE